MENESQPHARPCRSPLPANATTLQALPTLQPTLPNQTFAGKIIFHGTRRTAELIATGKGHTLSDCLLRLPQERVAFIGDIGFFQSQPFMPFGFPAEWVALLKEMAGWEIDTFIPGHGPVGSKTDLALEARLHPGFGSAGWAGGAGRWQRG